MMKAWRTGLRDLRGLSDLAKIRFDPTYRRLSADYGLPDGIRRVYCHHIRKTAGTSLFLSFLALGGEDPNDVWRRINASRLHRTISGPYAYASIHRRLLADGAYLFGRAHRPVTEQPLPPETFTVTVLRDPVARVRSYYDYLVTGDAADTPGQVAERERQLAADGFDVFLDRVPDHHLMSQLHTFSTVFDVSEAVDRIADCSSVFFTESFTTGLEALAGRLDLPLTPYRARVTGRRSELTDPQLHRLRHRLAPEYEMLDRLAAGGLGAPPHPSE